MVVLQAAAFAIALSALAWSAGALRRSGAAAAAAIGTLVLAEAGWIGGAILMAFFLPSSAVSRLWPGLPTLMDSKDDRRDAWQVLANGGVAALVLVVGTPGVALAFSAGLAAAAADTWATAVGAHSRTLPRHIFRGQAVPHGTSGGVTLLGGAGAAVGAALVAATSSLLVGWQGATVAFGVGMGGMLLDSALGAGLQGRFQCDHCDTASERKVHRCARATRLVGGYQWLTNDGVNALSTFVSTAVGWAAWGWCCSG